MTDTQPDTSIEVVAKKVGEGKFDSLALLLKAVAKADETLPAPAKPPLPAVITDEQREALDRLVEVFGSVQPAERRTLEPTERLALLEERDTLDSIEKLAKARKDAIRTAVLNHLDVEFEQAGGWAEGEIPLYDKDGHYVRAGEVIVPEKARKFTREVSERGPSLAESDLKALVDEGDLAHEDYLAMTTQTRVVDENKLMLHLRKKPGLVSAIQQATRPGSKIASMNVRKV